MLVSEMITLGRLHAQDTNTAAVQQPIGPTNYLLMVNDVLRVYRAQLDSRIKYSSHADLGNPTPGGIEFSTDGTPNIREVVQMYSLITPDVTPPTWTKITDGWHLPLQYVSMHRMKAIVGSALFGGNLPTIGNIRDVVQSAPEANSLRGWYYSYEFLSGEAPNKVHFVFNHNFQYVALEARLYHTDHTLTTDIIDASNDDAALAALALGAWAAELLDQPTEYIQALYKRMPERWATVYSAEIRRLIEDRRHEFGDARLSG